MTTWLNLRRLPNNQLPLPKYQTDSSGGIDFAACLTRPCIRILPNGNKQPFAICKPTDRTYLNEEYKLENITFDKKPTLHINQNEIILVPLGWQCEFTTHCIMQLHIRSSLGLRGINLANNVGIIDQDYRGDLMAMLHNSTTETQRINHGDRIVQGIIIQLDDQAIITETTQLTKTERGTGGLGSTGQQ